MNCSRCRADFESETPRCYCDQCVTHYRDLLKKMQVTQHPSPNILCDGVFTKEASPKSLQDAITNPLRLTHRCGLCGSEEVDSEYGMAGGYGLGSFTRCWHCHAIMDFVEDTGE